MAGATVWHTPCVEELESEVLHGATGLLWPSSKKEARLLPSLWCQRPPFVKNKRGHLHLYLYSRPHQKLAPPNTCLKSWEPAKLVGCSQFPSCVPKFPVPTTAHKFINHYCLLPLLLAFKSNEKPNFAAFWSFHSSGKVSIEISCCFCSESKPGKYTIYIYLSVYI